MLNLFCLKFYIDLHASLNMPLLAVDDLFLEKDYQKKNVGRKHIGVLVTETKSEWEIECGQENLIQM